MQQAELHAERAHSYPPRSKHGGLCVMSDWTTRWHGSAFYANSVWSILAWIWTHTEARGWIHNAAVHSEPQRWYTASVCDEAVCNLLLTGRAREDDSFLVSVHFILQQCSTLECRAFGGDRQRPWCYDVNSCYSPVDKCESCLCTDDLWTLFTFTRFWNFTGWHNRLNQLQTERNFKIITGLCTVHLPS